MKRKIIVTMAVIVFCLNLLAQDSLKIIFLEPSPVIIGEKKYKKGDMFLSFEAPKLVENQVMKVFDISSGKTRIITANLMKQSGNKTVWDYLTDSKRLSTRDPFNRTFGLFERISIKGSLPIDSNSYYYVSYEHKNETIKKRLPADGSNIVIDRSFFTIDNIPQTPFDVKLKLYYFDGSTQKSRLLSAGLQLNVSATDACRLFISDYLHSGLDLETIRELVLEYLDISCSDIEFQENDIELFVNSLNIK